MPTAFAVGFTSTALSLFEAASRVEPLVGDPLEPEPPPWAVDAGPPESFGGLDAPEALLLPPGWPEWLGWAPGAFASSEFPGGMTDDGGFWGPGSGVLAGADPVGPPVGVVDGIDESVAEGGGEAESVGAELVEEDEEDGGGGVWLIEVGGSCPGGEPEFCPGGELPGG